MAWSTASEHGGGGENTPIPQEYQQWCKGRMRNVPGFHSDTPLNSPVVSTLSVIRPHENFKTSINEGLKRVESYVYVFEDETSDKVSTGSSVLKFLSNCLIQFNHQELGTNCDFQVKLRSNQLLLL